MRQDPDHQGHAQGDTNRTVSSESWVQWMYQNNLYEHVEINHLVIKIVVNWTAQVLLSLNYFQTQLRALNLSYAGTPDGNPSRAALSSSWTFWASVEASSRSFAWVTRSTEGRFGPPRVISSLRLSRVESSTSRKGSPSPAWSSAAVVKAYSSPLLQPQDQLGLQQPSMRTRRGDETSIRSSPAGHGD